MRCSGYPQPCARMAPGSAVLANCSKWLSKERHDSPMIIQPYNIALRLDQRQTEQAFQIGSELRATVRSSSSGQLHLELADGRILTPQSTVSLQHGAQLLLRVTQTQPIVVLQIIQAESDSEAVQTALRALLATSGSRTSLVTSLAALFSTSAAARLPSDVTTAVQQ